MLVYNSGHEKFNTIQLSLRKVKGVLNDVQKRYPLYGRI